jgi:pyruvate dehydrogenase E2 component (dihydrolipoamide acetyltransferase)
VVNYKPGVSQTIQAQNIQSQPLNTKQTTSVGYQDVEISNIRKVIADRLILSKNTIPHFYIRVDCNVDQVMK